MLVMGIAAVVILAAILVGFANWHTQTHRTVNLKNFTHQSAAQGVVFAEAAKNVTAPGQLSANQLQSQGLLAKGFKATTPYGRHWVAESRGNAALVWTAGKPTRTDGVIRDTPAGINALSWKVAGSVWKKEDDPEAIVGVIGAGSATLVSYRGAYRINVSPWVLPKPYARTAIYFGPLAAAPGGVGGPGSGPGMVK